jgi:uncharacterized cupin superfamily protein
MAVTKLTATGLLESGVAFEPLTELPPYCAFLDVESVGFAHLMGEFAQPGEVAAMRIEQGGFAYTDTPGPESGFVLSGTAEISDEHGAITVGAGEGYLIPKGWTGTFTVTEPVIKVFYVL